MRPILTFALLLLGLIGAAPESESTSLSGDELQLSNPVGALLEIESSVDRTDRLSLESLQPRILRVETFKPDELRLTPADTDSDIPITDIPVSVSAPPDNTGTNQTGQASLDDLCKALFTSAEDNDLPVPFFANLLWQESRLRADDVSKKGAKGIAQFMPEAAAENGLADPFDPMQAIPASARLLQKLRLQFGNLGFVAAAYNAGAHRVIDWLEHRASLPHETRVYVARVTGLSVDTWRSIPIDNGALPFAQHLPCRSLPAFANVEQEQAAQMRQMPQLQVEEAVDEDDDAAEEASETGSTAHAARKYDGDDEHVHERKHAAEAKHAAEGKHEHAAHDEAHRATHDRHAAGHEASHAPHTAHEKHKSA